MRMILTTLGIAGAIAFGGFGATTTAVADTFGPSQTITLAASGEGNAADARSDRFRECEERARISGRSGNFGAECQVASAGGMSELTGASR